MLDKEKIDEYIDEKVKVYHKTCTQNDFDNGYFWAMKDMQAFICWLAIQTKAAG